MENETTQPKTSKGSILRRIGRFVDLSLTKFFATISYHVASRPYLTIFISVLVGLLMAAGIARIKVVTTAEDLYTPQGTDGFKDRVNATSVQ